MTNTENTAPESPFASFTDEEWVAYGLYVDAACEAFIQGEDYPEFDVDLDPEPPF